MRENGGKRILFALDGASGAGKTSLALAAAKTIPGLIFVPRYTTRKSRGSQTDAREYIFVSPQRFSEMIEEDAFIEYRSYKFGMRYGMPRKEIDAALKSGNNAIAIMNLGNVAQLKTQHPGAVTILIDVSQDTLQRRLVARGANTAEQIAERLESARTVEKLRPLYDEIIHNEDEFDKTLSALSRIVKSRTTKESGLAPRRKPSSD